MKLLNLALAFWLGVASSVAADMPEQGIVVTGEGTYAAVPDMAMITLGVRETAPSARDAMLQVSGAVAAILVKLDELGVADIDRQTSQFYLNPVYDPRPIDTDKAPQVISYEAGNSVTVRVRNLATLGTMMDAVLEIGANNFNGLSFGLKDDSVALATARALAVADARLRAEQLAQAASIKLGQIQRMTESSMGAQPKGMEMAQMRSVMSDAVAGGEVDVRAQVTIVYAIAP